MVFKKQNKIEKWFFVIGVVILLITISSALYSLFFLSSNMLEALSPEDTRDERIIFNLEEFEKLDL